MTMVGKSTTSRSKEMEAELANRQTPWASIITVGVLLFFAGLQFSVYFSSLWQYLNMIEPTVSVDFLGYVMASCAVGAALSSPILGYWNQKTGSTRHPLIFALAIAAIGNALYALLPSFTSNKKYLLLLARFLMGFFSGALGVLTSYLATASTKKDRTKAVAAGHLSLTIGFSVGPGVQMLFLFVDARWIGPFYLHVYNAPAYFMTLLCILAIFIILIAIKEDYVGIIGKDDKSGGDLLVVPKFDRMAVFVLFFLWWMVSGFFTVEGLYAPIMVALYNLSHQEAVLYIGLIVIGTCVFSMITTAVLAKTPLSKVDRRVQILFGLCLFLFYSIAHQPWPFYEAPLDPPREGFNVSDVGGCEFSWCEHTPRVPKLLYIFNGVVILGIAYPVLMINVSTLLSFVVGPRKQGFIQGFYSFIGYAAELAVPIFSTELFFKTGYSWIMKYHLVMTLICIFLVCFYKQRLQPLSLSPPLGKATKYKRGTFYRF